MVILGWSMSCVGVLVKSTLKSACIAATVIIICITVVTHFISSFDPIPTLICTFHFTQNACTYISILYGAFVRTTIIGSRVTIFTCFVVYKKTVPAYCTGYTRRTIRLVCIARRLVFASTLNSTRDVTTHTILSVVAFFGVFVEYPVSTPVCTMRCDSDDRLAIISAFDNTCIRASVTVNYISIVACFARVVVYTSIPAIPMICCHPTRCLNFTPSVSGFFST